MTEKAEDGRRVIDDALYAALMKKYEEEREATQDVGSFEDYINKLLFFSLKNYMQKGQKEVL